MKRKQKIIKLAIELIALLLGLIFVIVWVANEKKEVCIYDFSRSIQYNEKANYKLTEQDIVQSYILAADVQDYYIVNPEEAIGKYITGDCYKGQHIQTNQLSTDPTYINKDSVSELADYRKYYIKVGIGDVFAGDIEAGDTVDIMFSDSAAGYATERTSQYMGEGIGFNYSNTRIIMQNIPVYQVYLSNGQVYRKAVTDPETLNRYADSGGLNGDGTEQAPSGSPAYIALSVTAKQYEELAARQTMGTISLVARFSESKDTETNGYLVMKGSYANIYAGEGNLEYGIDITQNEDGEYPDASGVNFNGDLIGGNNGSIPALYSFIKDLVKVSMTSEQRQRYNSIYARYEELMNKYYGTEWQINEPDKITYEMLSEQVGTSDDAQVSALLAFRTDLETLAKELRGENVLLPW